jgi:hypothetical protein
MLDDKDLGWKIAYYSYYVVMPLAILNVLLSIIVLVLFVWGHYYGT